jgi:hypothetical protein
MLLKHILSEKIAGAPWGPKGTIKGGMSAYQKYDKLRVRLSTLVQQKNKVEQQLGIRVGEKELILIKRLALIDNMIKELQDTMRSHIDLPLDQGQSDVDIPFEALEQGISKLAKFITEAEGYCNKL